MDFSDEKPPKRPRFGAVRRLYGRYEARIARWWLWNMSYPVRMWLHFRFNREKALPEGRNALRAMLREAFAENGVTDFDLPYPVSVAGTGEKSEPGRFDLIFNRKRLKRA